MPGHRGGGTGAAVPVVVTVAGSCGAFICVARSLKGARPQGFSYGTARTGSGGGFHMGAYDGVYSNAVDGRDGWWVEVWLVQQRL